MRTFGKMGSSGTMGRPRADGQTLWCVFGPAQYDPLAPPSAIRLHAEEALACNFLSQAQNMMKAKMQFIGQTKAGEPPSLKFGTLPGRPRLPQRRNLGSPG